MSYGQMLLSQAPGAGIAHTLGTAAFCGFFIQDRTAGGVALPLQEAWINTKAAATFTLNDLTGGGPGVYDVLMCTPHSMIDAGPIVTAFALATSTRTAALTVRGRAPSYRSLHTNVAFLNTNATPGDDVTIIHNLGTVNVLVFVSPTSNPVDTGAAGVYARVFLQAINDLNTVTLRSVTSSGANFVADSPGTYDVMVLSAPTIGHSALYPRHVATAAGVNLGQPSYDYSDAAFLARAVQGMRPSYWAGYQNVDGIALIGGGGLVLTHNLRGNASMALVTPIATPGLMVPYVQNRATSVNTMTLAEIGAAGPMNNAQVAVFRSYSVVNL